MRLASAFLDLIAPARCLGCERRLESSFPPLCAECERRLPWWRVADGCPRCGIRMPLRRGESEPGLFERFDESLGCGGSGEGCPGCLANGSPLHACYALLRYEGPARVWIPGFKRTRGPFGPPPAILAGIDFLARELAGRLEEQGIAPPDCLVPIPLHSRRHRERGFNHAGWIARKMARILGRPCRSDALIRVRATKPQASLRGEARRDNIRHAFRAPKHLTPGARIWLVDDVLTTGTTVEAAAEALLEVGAEEVRALTLAATLPPRRRVRPPPETEEARAAR